jgi:hypothetical protein
MNVAELNSAMAETIADFSIKTSEVYLVRKGRRQKAEGRRQRVEQP